MQTLKQISLELRNFLTGGGDMAVRIRAHDWMSTPIGPIDGWPPALRYTLSSMLNSAFPMYLAWGADLISFYNDAYQPFLGIKPEALGRPFPEVWSEAWHQVGPVTDRALQGEASYLQDYTVTMDRNGTREKSLWTFAYSPVRDDGGRVQGVLCLAHETTERVGTEERLRSALKEVEAQQARFAALIENLPFGASLFGADGQELLTNSLCRKFLPGKAPSVDPAAQLHWTGFDTEGRILTPVDSPLRAGDAGRGRAGRELPAPDQEGRRVLVSHQRHPGAGEQRRHSAGHRGGAGRRWRESRRSGPARQRGALPPLR